jgi:hypothetical protein
LVGAGEVGRLFAPIRTQVGGGPMMNLSEYLQIEESARDRVGELRRAGTRRMAKPDRTRSSTFATMLYLASALRARPRAIDRYIDYFGEQVRQPR